MFCSAHIYFLWFFRLPSEEADCDAVTKTFPNGFTDKDGAITKACDGAKPKSGDKCEINAAKTGCQKSTVQCNVGGVFRYWRLCQISECASRGFMIRSPLYLHGLFRFCDESSRLGECPVQDVPYSGFL